MQDINRWSTVATPMKSLGATGSCVFATKHEAESYLFALPFGYEARVYKNQSGKWICSYRWTIPWKRNK